MEFVLLFGVGGCEGLEVRGFNPLVTSVHSAAFSGGFSGLRLRDLMYMCRDILLAGR